MGSAANLQLEIDKGELNIFVLCGNALEVAIVTKEVDDWLTNHIK